MATQIDQVATQIDQVATQIDQVATQIDQVATLFDVLAPQIVAIIREISRKGLVGGLVRPYFDDLYVDYKARFENNWKKKEKKKKWRQVLFFSSRQKKLRWSVNPKQRFYSSVISSP